MTRDIECGEGTPCAARGVKDFAGGERISGSGFTADDDDAIVTRSVHDGVIDARLSEWSSQGPGIIKNFAVRQGLTPLAMAARGEHSAVIEKGRVAGVTK